jgi:hypothetical protein
MSAVSKLGDIMQDQREEVARLAGELERVTEVAVKRLRLWQEEEARVRTADARAEHYRLERNKVIALCEKLEREKEDAYARGYQQGVSNEMARQAEMIQKVGALEKVVELVRHLNCCTGCDAEQTDEAKHALAALDALTTTGAAE